MEDKIENKILNNENIKRKFAREMANFMYLMKKIIDLGEKKNKESIKTFLQIYKGYKSLKIDFFINAFIKVYEEVRPTILDYPYNYNWPIEENLIISLNENGKANIKYSIVEDVELDKRIYEEKEAQLHKSLLAIISIIGDVEEDEELKMMTKVIIMNINKKLGILPEETKEGGFMEQLGGILKPESISKFMETVGLSGEGSEKIKETLSNIMKDGKLDMQQISSLMENGDINKIAELFDTDGKIRDTIKNNLSPSNIEKIEEYIKIQNKDPK